MTITTYHGSDTAITPRAGTCLTEDADTAANYAVEKNGGTTITEIVLDTDGLDGQEVDYDYDGGEPIIPPGCTADYAEYVDSDMWGRDHDSIMLLTDRAVAACTVAGTVEVDA